MNKIKCLIITDPIGAETTQEIIERISMQTDIAEDNFFVLGHENGFTRKAIELSKRADVLMIDYGGMNYGCEDMVIDQIRYVCNWAKDNPSKLAIILTSFTAEIYAQTLLNDFGECANIPYLFADAYSSDRDKVTAWLKTF